MFCHFLSLFKQKLSESQLLVIDLHQQGLMAVISAGREGINEYFSTLQLNKGKMMRLQSSLGLCVPLTTLLSFGYRTPQKVASFKERIRLNNKRLDRYDRVFLIRPPNLQSKNLITFPIKIPMRVRHIYNPKKTQSLFIENSERIHWNRLTPNEILLAFERIDLLEYNEMVEGLRFLSEVPGQEQHDWNEHAWVSKALDFVNNNFNRIKRKDYMSMYHLMKKLNNKSEIFWKQMYAQIEEMLYDMYPSEFEKFFLKYYKVSDQYFSPQMKEKFLSLMEGRLRSFQPSAIIKIYEIYEEENRLNDYWKYNVFIPLFKSDQYTYRPLELYKIFRFMLILNHEKDDRLYNSLYKRLMSYEKLELEEIEHLEEVIAQVKDLFISHRVDPYLEHLALKKKEIKKDDDIKKKEIPIQELVRQDLIYFMHKRKLESQQQTATS